MNPQQMLQMASHATAHLSDEQLASSFKHIHIIVSAPRSGSTLLFEQLCKQQDIWSIGFETHVIFNLFPHLRFNNTNQESGALDQSHADAKTIRLIRSAMLFLLQNHRGQRYLDPAVDATAQPLMVEKTPRNALNIQFLRQLFPQARFIYMHRQPQPAIASLIEAWQVGLQTGRFVTYPNLPGWHLPAWCFLLPSGWQDLIGHELAEIACFQWIRSNQTIQQDLAKLPADSHCDISYEALRQSPEQAILALLQFIQPGLNHQPEVDMVLSRSTLTPPDPNKWRRHEHAINTLRSQWQDVLKGYQKTD